MLTLGVINNAQYLKLRTTSKERNWSVNMVQKLILFLQTIAVKVFLNITIPTCMLLKNLTAQQIKKHKYYSKTSNREKSLLKLYIKYITYDFTKVLLSEN